MYFFVNIFAKNKKFRENIPVRFQTLSRCLYLTVMSGPSFLSSLSLWLVMSTCPGQPVSAFLSRMSHLGYPVSVTLFQMSSPYRPVPAVVSLPSCHGCSATRLNPASHVPAVLSVLYCWPSSPLSCPSGIGIIPTVLCGCPVHWVLRQSYSGYPVSVALFRLSCPRCPIPAILS
jgi:hypothetical protein